MTKTIYALLVDEHKMEFITGWRLSIRVMARK